MPRTPKTVAEPGQVVGYARVSTEEQAGSGLGLSAQRSLIQTECARREWTLLGIHEDAGISGKLVTNRPGLMSALADVEEGRAAGMVVAKLDRLSRSLADFANLMARAQAGHWNLVALDLGIDLSTPAGEFMANVMASAAQWERRIIGQRTRDALAVKRAQGTKLGRPSSIDPELAERIIADHRDGSSLSAIARKLNARGVPTAHGGARWYPSTVRAIVLADWVEK